MYVMYVIWPNLIGVHNFIRLPLYFLPHSGSTQVPAVWHWSENLLLLRYTVPKCWRDNSIPLSCAARGQQHLHGSLWKRFSRSQQILASFHCPSVHEVSSVPGSHFSGLGSVQSCHCPEIQRLFIIFSQLCHTDSATTQLTVGLLQDVQASSAVKLRSPWLIQQWSHDNWGEDSIDTIILLTSESLWSLYDPLLQRVQSLANCVHSSSCECYSVWTDIV